MKRTHEMVVQQDGMSLLSSDIGVVEDFINKDPKSVHLPEEVYFVLSSVVALFRGMRC